MGVIPRWLLRHTVIIEAYEGSSAVGPVYGAPAEVSSFVDEKRRKVRDSAGEEVISECTVFCDLGVVAPPKSRVTLPSGRQAWVITESRFDGGGLPVPDHLELALT